MKCLSRAMEIVGGGPSVLGNQTPKVVVVVVPSMKAATYGHIVAAHNTPHTRAEATR